MATEVQIIISARDLASQVLKGVTSSIDTTVSRVEKLASAGAQLALRSGIAYAGMVAAIRQVTSALDQQERAQRKLEAAVRGSGQAIDTERIRRYASELQRLTIFEDDATTEAAALLVGFGLAEDQIISLLPRVQDLAAMLDKDLNAAAQQVGRALSMGASALSRYGITMTASEKAAFNMASRTERVAMLVEILGRKTGPVSEMLLNTLGGAAEQTKNYFGDLQEEIGKLFEPRLVAGFKTLSKIITDVTSAIAGMDARTKDSIARWTLMATAVLGGIAALGMVATVLSLVTKTFAFFGAVAQLATVPWISSILLLTAGVALFRTAWERDWGGIRTFVEETAVPGILGSLKGLASGLDTATTAVRNAWAAVQEWQDRAVTWTVNVVHTGAEAVGEWGDRAVTWTVNLARGAAEAVADWTRGIVTWTVNLARGVAETVADWTSGIVTWTVNLARGAAEAVADWTSGVVTWVVNLARGATAAVSEWINGTVTWLVNLAKGAYGAVADWIDRAVDWTVNLVEGSTEKVRGWLSNVVTWPVRLKAEEPAEGENWFTKLFGRKLTAEEQEIALKISLEEGKPLEDVIREMETPKWLRNLQERINSMTPEGLTLAIQTGLEISTGVVTFLVAHGTADLLGWVKDAIVKTGKAAIGKGGELSLGQSLVIGVGLSFATAEIVDWALGALDLKQLESEFWKQFKGLLAGAGGLAGGLAIAAGANPFTVTIGLLVTFAVLAMDWADIKKSIEGKIADIMGPQDVELAETITLQWARWLNENMPAVAARMPWVQEVLRRNKPIPEVGPDTWAVGGAQAVAEDAAREAADQAAETVGAAVQQVGAAVVEAAVRQTTTFPGGLTRGEAAAGLREAAKAQASIPTIENRIELHLNMPGLAKLQQAIYVAEGGAKASVPYGMTGFRAQGDRFGRAENQRLFEQIVSELGIEAGTREWYAAANAVTVNWYWEQFKKQWNLARDATLESLSKEDQAAFVRFLGEHYAPPSAHPLNANWVPNVKKELGLSGYQRGVILPGYGGGDIIPALLEPGEAVVPAPIIRGGLGRIVEWFRRMGVLRLQAGAMFTPMPIPAGLDPGLARDLAGTQDWLDAIGRSIGSIGKSIVQAFATLFEWIGEVVLGLAKGMLGEEQYNNIAETVKSLKGRIEELMTSLFGAEQVVLDTRSADLIKWREWEGRAIQRALPWWERLVAVLGKFTPQDAVSMLGTLQKGLVSGLEAAGDAWADFAARIVDSIKLVVDETTNLISVDWKQTLMNLASYGLSRLGEAIGNLFGGTAAKLARQYPGGSYGEVNYLDIARMRKDYEDWDQNMAELVRAKNAQTGMTVGGGLLGAVIGFLAGGPIGALIGGGLGAGAGYAAGQATYGKRIEELQEKLKTTFQSIAEALGSATSDIANALGNAFSAETYSDFVAGFGQNLEGTVRSALIRGFLAGETMRPLLQGLSDLITQAVMAGGLDKIVPGAGAGVGAGAAVAERLGIGPTYEDLIRAQAQKIIDVAGPFYEVLKELDLGFGDLADAANEVTESLRNVPEGFKVAAIRWAVAEPIPQYHSGGVAGAEGLAWIRRDELVLTAAQAREIATGIGAGGGREIHVHHHYHMEHANVYGWDDFKRHVARADAENKSRRDLAHYGLVGATA